MKHSAMDPRPVRISVRVYQLLLRCYPARFRSRFGQDLLEAFYDCCRSSWANRGLSGLLGFWGRTLADLLGQSLSERCQGLVKNSRLPRQSLGIRKGNIMKSISNDLRLTIRALLRAPGFALVIILTLALAIGANTAIFSVISPYLFRPLPFEKPQQLVHLFETDPARQGAMGWDQVRQSLPTFLDWQDRLQSFEEIGAYFYGASNLSGQGTAPEQVTVCHTSANLFTLLGTEPAMGRLFESSQGAEGKNRVALISQGLWKSRFGSDPEVIGRPVLLDGNAYTVVGVMPEGFKFPFSAVRMWIPMSLDISKNPRDQRYLLTVGRLANNLTIASALQELGTVHSQIAQQFPDDYRDSGVHILPLRQALIWFYDQFRMLGFLLLFSVTLVLLVVCANLGNLMIARAAQRSREFAIRSALGASKGRLVSQAFLESLVLALCAALLGTLLASLGTDALGALMPAELFRVGEMRIDTAALAYSLLLALAAAAAFGIGPALRSARSDLATSLRESAGSTHSPRSRRLTRLMVSSQIAGAMVLCAGAVLMVQALGEVAQLELGFEPERLVTMSLNLPESSYPSGQQVRDFQASLSQRIQALPGVQQAVFAFPIPLDFQESGYQYELPARRSEEQKEQAAVNWVGPGYFQTMGIPLMQGRDFSPVDAQGSGMPVIVSASLARRHWPDGSPLGETILIHRSRSEVQEATVIGVAADSMGGFVFMGMQDRIFLPLNAWKVRGAFLVARTDSDPGALAPALRQQVRLAAPDLPVGSIRTMEEVFSDSTRPLKMGSGLLSGFGSFALLLAALGIYGVVSYAASLMGREIAIRLALGAYRKHIMRLVLRQGLGMILAGIGLGSLMTIAMALALASLDGSSALESTPALAMTGLLLGMVALMAAFLPIRRALRTDPMQVLRVE